MLTHKGKRTIHTDHGVVKFGEVYYGEGLCYNLISVPAMTRLGTKIVLGNGVAFLEKNGNRMNLEMKDGLWALPKEKTKMKIASLRMEMGGNTDAETWHSGWRWEESVQLSRGHPDTE